MVLPPGHAKAIATMRSLSVRERWMIRGVLAAVALLVVVLAVAIGTAGKSSGRGCIRATVAGPVGAEELDQCGSQARATCQSAAARGAFPASAVPVIERQCRKAGLPVGS